MLKRYIFLLVLLFSFLTGASVQAETDAMVEESCPVKWRVHLFDSMLGFSGRQMAVDFSGRFGKFSTKACFDPAHLDQSHVHVTIDISTFTTGDGDRDNAALTKDWFDVDSFPAAYFSAHKFEKMETEDTYEAHGTLKIKGIEVPVVVPFTVKFSRLESEKRRADVTGEVILDRSRFALGTGDWADPSVIANEVKVVFKLYALEDISG